MSLVTAHNLHKSFGPQVLLQDASFSLQAAERVGLVGVNGSGKSTLARIIAGRDQPDTGTITRQRDAEIAYLDQAPAFEGEPSAREVVTTGLKAWSDAIQRYEAASKSLETGEGDVEALLEQQATAAADVERLGGWDRSHEVDSMLGYLGIARPDAPVTQMSGGERRRVALAQILVARPALAVLDEPTNHLDVETVEWLENFLCDSYPGAILLITHDRYMLDRVATRTLELDQGQLYRYDGGYEAYLLAKGERMAHAQRTESNRQNFLRRELEWLRRQPKARGTKQKARIDRAEAAKGTLAPKAERTASLSLQTQRSGKTILEIHDASLAIEGRVLVEQLNLILTQGERIGIVGRNGTGKTTLLRALVGELEPVAGEIKRGVNTQFAYFDQERSGLDDRKSIFDNVAGDRPSIEINGQPIEPRSYLEKFLFDPSKQRQPVGSLSGGERARVALAKMLRDGANLVLLDEPTNDLDVATLGALEQMLVDFGGTCLVVTHDRYFLDRVATSILAFEGDGKVVHYPGNYTMYRDLRSEYAAERLGAEKPASTKNPSPSKRPPPATGSGLSSAEKKELAGLLDRIAATEEEVTALETRLGDPTTYASGDARALAGQLTAQRGEVVRLTARWEELEGRAGS